MICVSALSSMSWSAALGNDLLARIGDSHSELAIGLTYQSHTFSKYRPLEAAVACRDM